MPVPARDAMREVPGHEFKYHHLGMIQALPELPDSILPAFSSSSSVDGVDKSSLGGTKGPDNYHVNVSLAKDTSPGPAAAVTTSHVLQLTPGAIFHRTSFNSKFFPDCLRAPFPAYCQVQFVSVPLTSEQAGHSLKPHMFAFKDSEINSTAWQDACANMTKYPTVGSTDMHNNTANNSNSSDDEDGFPERTMHGEVLLGQAGVSMVAPEHACSFEAGKVPIPVLPVELHSGIVPVLQASYKAYADLRKELNVRRARRLLMH